MLVRMKEILDRAKKDNYGVTAPNVQSEDTVRAVIKVAEKCNSPMIIDVNAFIHPDLPWFIHMIRDLTEKSPVPFAINLDHGKSYEDIMLGINSGFTSIMVDCSSLSYEDNIAQTKETVKMCRPLNISVEAELGHVGQGVDYSSDGSDHFTNPEEARKFVEETGIDCLAVAIGTAHGIYPKDVDPKLRLDILEEIEALTDIPLVLHGGSSNPDEEISKAVTMGVNKINISSDIKIVFANKLREVLNAGNNEIREPNVLFPECMEETKKVALEKIRLFKSEDKVKYY